jgi:hypothetical protein
MKIMLEAGADVSLESVSEGFWISTFMFTVTSGSVVNIAILSRV